MRGYRFRPLPPPAERGQALTDPSTGREVYRPGQAVEWLLRGQPRPWSVGSGREVKPTHPKKDPRAEE